LTGERLVVGCMTGTSLDGLDAALVRVRGRGLNMTAELLKAEGRGLGDLGVRLRSLSEGAPISAGEVSEIARRFGELHAEAVVDLLRGAGVPQADLVCAHGQTVFHRPPDSWQLFNPWPVVERLRAPVVFDLRGADLARGGQGAPITPIADWVLLRSPDERRAVVNLGGFSNATLLEPASAAPGAIGVPTGFDICPCNHVLDGVARAVLRVPFDEDGAAALSGRVLDEPLVDLEGVLASVSRAGRSLGSGDEALEWVSRWRSRCAGADLAATACEAIGHAVADRCRDADRILVAGGGARNRALVRAIAASALGPVEPTDAHGVPGAWREAMEFAVLGALCQDRVPITPSGAVAGCWAGAT
jgi:anhydro-N-acetylmuramic acid kinase